MRFRTVFTIFLLIILAFLIAYRVRTGKALGEGQGLCSTNNADGSVTLRSGPSVTPTPLPTPTPVPRPAVNVKAFGAKGDGKTDDTVAVKAAWNTAMTGERPLYFPTGRYIVASQATSDGRANLYITGSRSIRVFGDGMKLSIIKTLDKVARLNGDLTEPVQISTTGTVEFDNIGFEGPEDPKRGTWESYTTHGIAYSAPSGQLILDGVKMRGFTHAIKVDRNNDAPTSTVNATIRNSDISGLSMGLLMTNRGKLRVEHSDFHDTGAVQEYISPNDNLPKAKNDHHIYLYGDVTAEVIDSNFWNNGGFSVQVIEPGTGKYLYVRNCRIGNEAVRQAGGSWYNGMPPVSAPDPNWEHGYRGRNVGQARGIMTIANHPTYVLNSQFAVNWPMLGAICHNGTELVVIDSTFLRGNGIFDIDAWNPKQIVLKNVVFKNAQGGIIGDNEYAVMFFFNPLNRAIIYTEGSAFPATTGFFLATPLQHEVHWYGAIEPRFASRPPNVKIIHESGVMPASLYAVPAVP